MQVNGTGTHMSFLGGAHEAKRILVLDLKHVQFEYESKISELI